MEVEQILRAFGIILGAGLISQLISTFLRIPEMIVLVAVGALIGPSVLGIVSNPLDEAGAQLLFTIGVSMILFHGGTGISLRVISRTAVGLALLALPGVLLTAFIVALAVAPVFGVAFTVFFDGLDDIPAKPAELRTRFCQRFDEFVRELPPAVAVVVTCRTRE